MGIIAIFGGTFNPIHIGHIEIVKELSTNENIEKILVMPAKLPPHKSVDFLAEDDHRVKMCELAVCDITKAEVCKLELERAGKSYTVDTIKEVKKKYQDKDIAITIGADMVVTFDEWKDYKVILENAKIITFGRSGTNMDSYNDSIAHLKELGADLIKIEGEISHVSSTEIRNALINGGDTSGLLDCRVYEYILDNNVYGVRNGL